MSWTADVPSGESTRSLFADLVLVARRRSALILLVLLGTMLGSYVVLSFIAEQYEAEARLLVKLGRENAEVPLTVDKGGVYSTGVAKEEINSNIQLLTSRSLIEATVDKIGVERFMFRSTRPPGFFKALKYYAREAFRWVRGTWQRVLILLDLKKDLTDREKAVNLLVGVLKATRERDSNVIIVSMRLPDPVLAGETMSALLETYLQRHIQVQRDGKLREVFEEQASTLGRQLEQLQGRIARLKQDSRLSSVPEQRSQLLQRLDQLKREIDAKVSEQSRLQSELAALQSRLEALPASTKSLEVLEPNRGNRAIKERLVALRLKRVETAERYSDDFQLVKNIDEEIASLEKLLGTEEATQAGDVTYQRNPLTAEFEAEAERIKVKQVGLTAATQQQRGQVAAIESELRRLDAGGDRLQLAELERRVLEEKYLASATRSSAARIADDLDLRQVANLAVLGPPTVPAEPVYPPKLLIMGVALAAGLLLGFGLALVLEWASDVIHAPGDIAAIEGVPFLGQFRFGSGGTPVRT